MNFEKEDFYKRAGEYVGYLSMYFIFTTILYFILKILGKLPLSWNYLYVLNLTLFIVLIGILVGRVLR